MGFALLNPSWAMPSAQLAMGFASLNPSYESSVPSYGFSGTVSGLSISWTATTRTLAGSVLLALPDTA
jgi:hypothetical protein